MTNIEFYKKDVEKEISKGKSMCLALNEIAHEKCQNGKVKHCLDYENCYKCSRDVLDWLLEEYNVDWSQVEPGTKCLVRDYYDAPWIERELAFFAFDKPWFFVVGSIDTIDSNMNSLHTYRYYKLKEDEE